VHDREGRLLLIRRGREPNRGRWSLPGGRVEPGETDEQALVRELAEETALVVNAGPLCGQVRIGRYDIYDYWCTIRTGYVQSGDDAIAVAWVNYANFVTLAAQHELTPSLAETLRRWHALPR